MDRPFLVTARTFVRAERTLVRAAVHQGTGANGSPLWAVGWILPLGVVDFADQPADVAMEHALRAVGAAGVQGSLITRNQQDAWIRSWRK